MSESNPNGTVRGILSLLAETSVHAGTGAHVGTVDLPIQRERHTEWPTIYGTGLKGVFRAAAEALPWQAQEIRQVFGPETKRNGEKDEDRHSGALAISDARVLLFPVRTVGPAFAWVTCPLAIARLRRDAEQAGLEPFPDLGQEPSSTKEVLHAGKWPGNKKQVLLEELVLEARVDEAVGGLGGWIAEHLMPDDPAYHYWRNLVQTSLVVVSDDDFRDFVRHGTEIVNRVKLGNTTKTVEPGALWSEENLPADSLLYSFAVAWNPVPVGDGGLGSAGEVMAKFRELITTARVVQVGGNETVGRGVMAVRLAGGGHE